MGDFMNLRVWQKAKESSIKIYQITNKGDFRHNKLIKWSI